MDGKIQGLLESLKANANLSKALSNGYFGKNNSKCNYYDGKQDGLRMAIKMIEDNF